MLSPLTSKFPKNTIATISTSRELTLDLIIKHQIGVVKYEMKYGMIKQFAIQ